jgi:hypothetical protein
MEALQDPKKAQSDTILRTVMMLWLFEVSELGGSFVQARTAHRLQMVTYDPQSNSSLEHLHGAASLVALRGSQNFEDKRGLRKILRICFATVRIAKIFIE